MWAGMGTHSCQVSRGWAKATMESGEREEGTDSQEREMLGDQTEGKECNSGRSEEDWEGKSSTEKDEAPKKEENNGGEDLAEHQSYNESGEDAGGNNKEDPCVHISSPPKSPCRQRKEKGLVDLGIYPHSKGGDPRD